VFVVGASIGPADKARTGAPSNCADKFNAESAPQPFHRERRFLEIAATLAEKR
jgi:hypothetical protein